MNYQQASDQNKGIAMGWKASRTGTPCPRLELGERNLDIVYQAPRPKSSHLRECSHVFSPLTAQEKWDH